MVLFKVTISNSIPYPKSIPKKNKLLQPNSN